MGVSETVLSKILNSIVRLLPRKVSPITQLSGISTSVISRKKISDPTHPNDLHRAGGIASFMRVPIAEPPKTEGELDVVFLGIPLDTATSNRPGARFGPRHIRAESPMVRKRNHATGAQPFDTLAIADIGDVGVCLYDIKRAADTITEFYHDLMKAKCIPLTMGGDHFVTYPILRAISKQYGQVALIHVDAHSDTAEHQSYFDLTHGTPFRRAHEDNLLDNSKVSKLESVVLDMKKATLNGDVIKVGALFGQRNVGINL